MQIKPMFTRFNVLKTEPFNSQYSLVTFNGSLRKSSVYYIPRLKYRAIISNEETRWSNGAVGRETLKETRELTQPLLTRTVHSFHDRLFYGRMNRLRLFYTYTYENIIFPILNKN